jgi:hypothetical protein
MAGVDDIPEETQGFDAVLHPLKLALGELVLLLQSRDALAQAIAPRDLDLPFQISDLLVDPTNSAAPLPHSGFKARDPVLLAMEFGRIRGCLAQGMQSGGLVLIFPLRDFHTLAELGDDVSPIRVRERREFRFESLLKFAERAAEPSPLIRDPFQSLALAVETGVEHLPSLPGVIALPTEGALLKLDPSTIWQLIALQTIKHRRDRLIDLHELDFQLFDLRRRSSTRDSGRAQI